MIIAVLMAGGKGTRMDSSTEKPLFNFKNKPLIDYVLKNLSNSKYIEKIVVATSQYTTKTKGYLDKKKFIDIDMNCDLNENNSSFYNYIETPGKGYLEDLSFLLAFFEKKSNDDILVFINSDLPFLSSTIIDEVLDKYLKNEYPAMSVLVPVAIFNKYDLKPSYVFDELVPSGLNILISKNEIQEEEKLIIPKIELALNINTIDDVKVANYLFDNNIIK